MLPATIVKPRDSPSNSGVDKKSLITSALARRSTVDPTHSNYTPSNVSQWHTDQIADSATRRLMVSMEDPLRFYEAEPRVIAVPGRAWDRD